MVSHISRRRRRNPLTYDRELTSKECEYKEIKKLCGGVLKLSYVHTFDLGLKPNRCNVLHLCLHLVQCTRGACLSLGRPWLKLARQSCPGPPRPGSTTRLEASESRSRADEWDRAWVRPAHAAGLHQFEHMPTRGTSSHASASPCALHRAGLAYARHRQLEPMRQSTKVCLKLDLP
ncbi:hypothetical protein Salat_0213600 [Sesamum alatum]|uniref:Uncharacterized protein n=1 Tax=Sesamum alatum TaxID=300844 RepID=A0AAE1YY55_9LAMI|nr:hypothetical protein Salat_0213600 [Sesamum alatum]